MNFKVSRHAQLEMKRRGITSEILEHVLQHPQQIVPASQGKKAYQSILDFTGKKFLIPTIVADAIDPPVVITIYRTSKVHKYWRMP